MFDKVNVVKVYLLRLCLLATIESFVQPYWYNRELLKIVAIVEILINLKGISEKNPIIYCREVCDEYNSTLEENRK